MRRALLTCLLVPLALAACGDEDPLEIGSELLPPQALRSFEVLLEPEQFLVRDTAFSYGQVTDADFLLLARDFEGVLDAHGFARFQMPTAIGVTDTLGVARTDSTPTLLRGEVVLYVDSLAEYDSTWNFRVAAHALAEPWDTAGLDWEFRQPGVRWSTPGGTRGALLASAQVHPDSIVLPVDSATLRLWKDTTNTTRGVLLSLLDPGRIRTARPVLRLFARSRYKPDTTYVVVSQAPGNRFDYRPRLASVAGEPRVSGIPNWRTFLQFRPDLGDLTVSCGPGCSLPLREGSITRAELVLQPVRPPSGFLPERPLQPAAYQALAAPEFPLQRTPIGTAIGTTQEPVPPARFTAGGAPVYVVLTSFVQEAVADTARTPGTAANSGWLALLNIGETTLGIGTFAPGPRLRLVVSSAREIQLP